jgi:hypothetical protein
MALDEEFPLQFFYGEAPFFMKASKLGCHKKIPVVIWGRTQSFREMKFIVIEGRSGGELNHVLSKVVQQCTTITHYHVESARIRAL